MSMFYPQLSDTEKDSGFIRAFNGLNHNPVSDESTFYDMKNCTTDKFPLLTRRKLRLLSEANNASAIGCMDGVAWIADGYFYYKGVRKFAVSGTVKQLVQFGAYICIFPQGITYNTQTGEMAHIGLKTEGVKLYAAWGLKRANGDQITDNEIAYDSVIEPANPSEGYYWQDTSQNPPVIRQWSRNQQRWVDASVYVDIAFYKEISAADTSMMSEFREGDTIKISGLENVSHTTGQYVSMYSTLNGTHVIQKVIHNYNIAVDGVNCWYLAIRLICPRNFFENIRGTDNVNITLERVMPDMDFVCANAGHMFGCSNEHHEIYVSANADPYNWNTFEGTANDSYAEVVGTPGEFTGCAAYRSTVLFFKEDRIHVLYGKRPSAYQLDQLECVGLQKGCHNTIAIANETLFYKGRYGIYAYSGGLPELVSEQLGDYNKRSMTAGGSDGRTYYVYGGGSVFSYDPKRGLWAKEDDRRITQFADNGLDLFFIEQANTRWSDNLLNIPASSQTVNGVTFTANGDGSVTVNGTATAEASFRVCEYSEDEAPVARLRVTGCPSDATFQTYGMRAAGYNSVDTYWCGTLSTTLPVGYGIHYIDIVVRAGTSVNDVVFTPTLEALTSAVIGAMENYSDAGTETGLTMTMETDAPWSASTGWIGLDSPDEKYISRIRLRLELPIGSVFIVDAAYDNGDFSEVERINGDGLKPVNVVINPRRCDVMRLRFHGTGDFKLYSIAKQYEQGSDVF